MAITKMKRLSAVTLKEDAAGLIASLQLLRCIDLSPTKVKPDELGLTREKRTEELADLRRRLARATSSEEFLAAYSRDTKGLLPKHKEIALADAEKKDYSKAERKSEETQSLMEEMATLNARLIDTENELAALVPWTGTSVELPFSETETSKAVCGILPARFKLSSLDSILIDTAVVIEPLKTDEKQQYVRLIALKEDFDFALSALNEAGFTPCTSTVKASDGFADGKIMDLRTSADKLRYSVDELKEKAKALSEYSDDIELYCDILTTEIAREEAAEKLYSSERATVITGWIPEKRIPEVTALFEERGDAYSFEDPDPEENVPVQLSNNAFASSFEPVIALYSMPAYGTFDPSSIMSVFFFLIFGLMLADVGYGFLMALFCILGIKLLKPQGSLKQMLTMFAWCGLSCMIMGVLFGGYFSDAPSYIMKNWFGMQKTPELALWINPMNDPMSFLIVSLAVGAVHLITALCIKFYIVWANGKRLDAVCDTGSWIVLFLGAGLYAVNMALSNAVLGYVALGMIALGVLMLICTQGRAEKNIFMKFFKGVASLYDIIAYVSDLLSYSRILSLGLASMVIGSVFNILGTLPGFSVVGVIFFFVIFTVGHLLNLAINMLGSFVHTSRLQYIEFFGKFYEDGGKPFEPLTPHSKYVVFK